MDFLAFLISERQRVMLFMFMIMGLILAVNMFRSFLRTREFFGNPPIHAVLFAAGKAANIAIWAAFISHLLGRSISFFPVPPAAEAVGFALFITGSVYITASFLALGITLRFGLSESNALMTGGIYRISRNPMYVGFFMIDAAAIVYTLNPILLVLLALGLYTHHRTVLSEERFLQEKFGDAWESYRAKVRRYI